LEKHNAILEEKYPYSGKRFHTCMEDQIEDSGVGVESFKKLKKNDPDVMKSGVAQ